MPRRCEAGAEGEGNDRAHSSQDEPTLGYAVSESERKLVSGLPVAVGPAMLDRIRTLGWIQLRALRPRTEIRLTQSGLDAMKAPV